jgi:RNAse (barnase) inhibitor barstar
MKIPEFIIPAWNVLMRWISKLHWNRTRAVLNNGIYYKLREEDHDQIRELLARNYFIILTRSGSHLTSHLVSVASLFIEGKLSHYTHALMNVEGDIPGNLGYHLIEATNVGVHYSTFMEVFDCDSVALLAPKDVGIVEWTKVLDTVKDELGKDYDTLFDIMEGERVSCVELVYWGLRKLPDFQERFPKLIELVHQRDNNLTPQMLYDTGELDIIFEVRR